MTRQELDATWTRYMHRSDLSADLDTAYDLTAERISERLYKPTVDIDDILLNSPRMLVHGGLAYLAELAQDDEQLNREMQLFGEAVTDYSQRDSITTRPTATASRPYFDEVV